MASGGDIAPPDLENTKREIRVILAGKTGAGKSTLVKRMACEYDKIPPSAKPTTKSIHSKSIEKNGKTLVIYDTPGLIGDESAKKKELKEWSHKLKKDNIDLLVCCIPVGPSAKFEADGYPLIMQCLHESFGSNIWNKCVVAFTYSNDAVQACGDTKTYKNFIEEFKICFQDELKKLNGVGIQTMSIFEWQRKKGNVYHSPGTNTIIAIPAGDQQKDPVLPGIGEDWDELMFIHWALKCNLGCMGSLIQFRWGHAMYKSFVRRVKQEAGPITGGAIGAATGGAGGLKLGAAIGSVGGPAGAAVGAAAGAAVGAGIGALVTAYIRNMKKNTEDKKAK